MQASEAAITAMKDWRLWTIDMDRFLAARVQMLKMVTPYIERISLLLLHKSK